MRAVYAILLFAFVCSLSIARADVIFSGGVSTHEDAGTTCSASGAAAGNLSLSCDDSISSAMVSGSGDAFSGSAAVHSFAPVTSFPSGSANATLQLELSETYLMTGGVGDTTVNFTIVEPEMFAFTTCSFLFDGVTQLCPNTISETVEYGVPFSVQLNFQAIGNSFRGDPQDALLTYDFAQPGLVTTPEPSSVLLFLPGLVGIGIAARSRAKGGGEHTPIIPMRTAKECAPAPNIAGGANEL